MDIYDNAYNDNDAFTNNDTYNTLTMMPLMTMPCFDDDNCTLIMMPTMTMPWWWWHLDDNTYDDANDADNDTWFYDDA